MDSENELDFRQYVSILRRRFWIPIAAIVLCVLAAALVSFLQPKMYSASARVLISAQQDIATGTGGALSDPNQLQNQMQTQVQIAESPAVEQAARLALGAQADQIESVAAGGVANTRVLSVTATSRSPEAARLGADAFAAAYLATGERSAVDRVVSIGQAVEERQQQVQQRIDELNREISGASTAAAGASRGERDALNQQLTQLQQRYRDAQAAALVREATAAPLADAELPTSPSSPKPLRNMALALVLGALIGVGIALIVDRLDDRVHGASQLTQWFPALPQLGTIPQVEGWTNESEAQTVTLLDPQSPVSEAYRGLRTNIEFLGLERELQVIEFTSAASGEGKTTTVANLATAMAWGGKSVVVVSGDLRRPRLHQFFGLSNEVGLTTVLLNGSMIDDVLQRVSVQDESLYVLPTGQLPPNPAELLATPGVADLFKQLRASFDYVLIDSPPVLPVADPLVLSKYADGIVLVAGVDKSRKQELTQAVQTIEHSTKTPLLGVLVNGGGDNLSYTAKYGYSPLTTPT